MRASRQIRLSISCVLVLTVLALPYVGAPAVADDTNQNFETWPTTGTWGLTTHEGWNLSDAQVRINRGGFGPPIDLRCAWLHDFDDSANSWLESPVYPAGVISVSMWTRRDLGSGGTSTAKLQMSSNQVEWIDVEEFAVLSTDWTQCTFAVNSFDPIHLRIRKTGDTAINTYAGLDDIEVTLQPPVVFSNLGIDPSAPTREQNVDVFVNANIQQSLPGVVMSTFYRFNSTDAFTELPMTLDAGITYRTTGQIPSGAGLDGTVQYYVQAAFDLGGPQLTFMPAAGSNAPAFYRPTYIVVDAPPRQLNPSSRLTPFIFSEIMYHPSEAVGTNSMEYIEIFNSEPVPRDMSGFRISGDVDYIFPSGTMIGGRDFIVVARDPDAVQQAHGLAVVQGPYVGNLPNNGGTVRLRNDFGGIVLEVNYEDQLPWPIAADGAGHSLLLARPDFGEGSVRAWAASAFVGGSPGMVDPTPDSALRDIVINEYLTHTDLPDTDYIELYNRGTQSVDISGCGLSNTTTTNKFFIPSATTLQPGTHVVYDQATLGFSLSAGGDEIYLWAPDFSNVVDAVRFDAQVNGVPGGRYPDGAANLHALSAQSPGTANTEAQLLLHDVVINEIMYGPLSSKSIDEYIELYNRGTSTIDVSYWRFIDGVDYLFPPGTVIPADGYLVVAKDMNNLLSKYPQLNSENLVGNFSGQLSDGGERVALAKPDDLDFPFEDLVLVDDVTFSDGDRWGKWADRGGSSLELIDARSDNRLAMNWMGSDETDKSTWTTAEHTGKLEHGAAHSYNPLPYKLNVFIPNEGECLVDDIEVLHSAEGTNNRIRDPGFNLGLGDWSADGNHIRTSYNANDGFANPGSMLLRSSGHGYINGKDSPWLSDYNFVERSLAPWLNPGETATIRAKVRWLAGWPVCVLGLQGAYLETVAEMDVPANLGSPGLQNSRHALNTGPAISELVHSPILPMVNVAVTVTCRAHDPDGLSSLMLEYRLDPSTTYSATAMRDDGTGGDRLAGDGIYSGLIPGQASGTIVAFRVRAADAHANSETSWVPSNDPTQDALLRFGEIPLSGLFGTHMIWMSTANVNVLTRRPPRSDEPLDITFVYGHHRVIYNARMRYRGNARPYPDYRDASYSCSMPKSDRFLGSNEFQIDIPSRSYFDGTYMQEYHAYWTARKAGMAASTIRFIRVRVNGSSLVRQDFLPASRNFCRSWYGDADPVVFEQRGASPFENFQLETGEKAQHRYRFIGRKKRTTKPVDDFQTWFNIIDAGVVPDNALFDARMEALIDPFGWASYFVVNKVVGNRDSYNWTHDDGRHMFFFMSPTYRSRIHLHDMDFSYKTDTGFTLGSVPLIQRLFNDRPVFKRDYWRVLKSLMDGPLRAEVSVPELQCWFEALQASGITAVHPQAMMDWNATRVTEIANALPVAEFEITSHGGNDFVTANRIETLNGNAPIDVASFRINGRAQRVTYPTETTWQARLGLESGINTLVVEGFDRDGNLVASDTIAATLTAAVPSPIDGLVISEIMYHPSAPQAEYVEIFNRSAYTFDLGGWRLNGVDLEFDGGALIGPGEYKVAVENITAYQHAYGNAEQVIGDYASDLDNGGETLTLQMPVGSNAWVTIDEVFYDDNPPWSATADGTGAALQLIDHSVDNNRAGNWGVVPSPIASIRTPGAANANASGLFAFPQLWINEVMPSNTSTVADNFGEFEPWIELYNADSTAIDLSVYRLSNDHQDPLRWAFPAGTTIAAASRLLLWADGEVNQTGAGVIHTDFRLKSSSGSVILARQWLGDSVVVDYLDYDSLAEGTSYGSFPEGDPSLRVTFQSPTPYTANNFTSATVQVVINEWMSDNETTKTDPSDGNQEDWIELFNPSTSDADLNGYFLTDNLAMTDMFAIPAGTTVPAGGFLFVWADNEPGQNGPGVDLHVNFSLSRNGDAIGLYAPSGVLVDSAVFGPQSDDQSHGCWPDGSPSIYAMTPPTPADTNSVFVGFMIDMSDMTTDVYRVEANDDLFGTNWIVLDVITAINGVLTFTDTNAVSMPARFYRLSEEQ
jgi:hypothetical protein